MRDLFECFDRLDTRLNQWLVAYSIPVLRIALGGIFLAFGLLTFFPGLSLMEELATRTTEASASAWYRAVGPWWLSHT